MAEMCRQFFHQESDVRQLLLLQGMDVYSKVLTTLIQCAQVYSMEITMLNLHKTKFGVMTTEINTSLNKNIAT
jgi:hypothetical protein